MDLKRAATVHLICTLIVVGIGWLLGGPQQAVSALIGAAVVFVSVGFMVWSIERLFQKKSIALAGMVIVIKYLLLGVALYWITLQPWAHMIWVAAGVASVVMTTVFYSLTAKEI